MIANLQQALTLLVVGMTVVFCFLAVLIVAITLVQRLCARYFAAATATTALADNGGHSSAVGQSSAAGQNSAAGQSSAASGISPQVVAAITAAVHQYRRDEQGK